MCLLWALRFPPAHNPWSLVPGLCPWSLSLLSLVLAWMTNLEFVAHIMAQKMYKFGHLLHTHWRFCEIKNLVCVKNFCGIIVRYYLPRTISTSPGSSRIITCHWRVSATAAIIAETEKK